ncbi:MAG TPA: hypothetical protein VFU86_05455 [Terriglobales bacterium]|nr:hypothetical protein [Terriglobales bacterium]
MPIEIEVGSLLLRAGLQGPDTFLIHTTSYSAQWDVVVGQDGFALERALGAAGWHLMYLAGAVHAIAFGRREGKNARLAVDRVLAKIRKQDFNAAEVDEISTKHFLGIPYVSVSANARHLQQGNALQDQIVRRQAQHDLEWARD